ncbi:MAG: hypothetical protein Kow0062_12180 [Acidobacteriota bacterium]
MTTRSGQAGRPARRGFLFLAAPIGALGAAIVASACCWLPLLLIGLGVSGGALAALLEAWRPALLGLTAVMLAAAFWLAYRRPAGRPDEDCCETRSGPGADRKLLRRLVWPAAVLALGFALSPWWAEAFFRGSEARSLAGQGSVIRLRVGGMSCAACEKTIEQRLARIPGVADVAADADEGAATIRTTGPVAEDQLQRAVEQAGYAFEGLSAAPDAAEARR